MIELECYLPEITEEMQKDRLVELMADRANAIESMDEEKILAYARKWHIDELLESHRIGTFIGDLISFWVIVHLMRVRSVIPDTDREISARWLDDRGFAVPEVTRVKRFKQWLR